MCCFSGKVQSVSNTRIFARMGAHGNQVIAYSMALSAPQDVAMLLPIPVARDKGDDAVKFVSLETYPTFFGDLDRGFQSSDPFGAPSRGSAVAAAPQLKVESVGSYDASYVPTIADFSRLDARFVLPKEVWEKLPGYKDFGFAVFKLKAGNTHVHPMAFAFDSANKGRLFFPTVHIHDGEVHERAQFDHTLYCQLPTEDDSLPWNESSELASTFVKMNLAAGMVRPNQHVYRKRMNGELRNEDVALTLKGV